jgi:putative transposase
MTIFHTDHDWNKFISFLECVITKYNWICHAYCLMGTHYHILLETPDANTVPGMKQLNQFYSQYYNWKYRRVGPDPTVCP